MCSNALRPMKRHVEPSAEPISQFCPVPLNFLPVDPTTRPGPQGPGSSPLLFNRPFAFCSLFVILLNTLRDFGAYFLSFQYLANGEWTALFSRVGVNGKKNSNEPFS